MRIWQQEHELDNAEAQLQLIMLDAAQLVGSVRPTNVHLTIQATYASTTSQTQAKFAEISSVQFGNLYIHLYSPQCWHRKSNNSDIYSSNNTINNLN